MEQKERIYKLLGQFLLDKELITNDQLDISLKRQKETGKFLGDILVESGFIGEKDILSLLREQADIKKISNLSEMELSADLLSRIPVSLVKLYKILPVKEEDTVLIVASANPFDMRLLDDLRFILDRPIEVVMANEKELEEAIQNYYVKSEETFDDIMEVIERKMGLVEVKEDEGTFIDLKILRDMASQEPVVKLINLLLLKAINDRASDLHFEPFEDVYKVRCRVNGILKDIAHPPKNMHLAMSSRIKVLANLDIAERRLPQDGRILMVVEDKKIDIRVSTLSTMFGEAVVLRILDKSTVNLSLDQIGLRKIELDIVDSVINKPNGIILATGPTGSGKTTTLYSCINAINKVDFKVITLEDPVEYNIFGIIQVPVRPKINFDFAMGLRHILRQDPDIILVGEIRDVETAKIAIQASLTGHLVFSTLHTNDASGTITRLINMGIEPYLVASTLRMVIAQRLVRTLCQNCKEAFIPSAEELAMLEISPNSSNTRTLYRARGCSHCDGTGYSSRTGIFEVLTMNNAISSLIMNRSSAAAIRQRAIEGGMIPLRQYGFLKICEGITTLEEVIKQTLDYK